MKKGGFRDGSGRKPKATEIELIEKLSPLDEVAFKSLEKGVKSGDFAFIKLFMEYRYGKPKQQVTIEETMGKEPTSRIVIYIPDNGRGKLKTNTSTE
jgi:hypothetical protein